MSDLFLRNGEWIVDDDIDPAAVTLDELIDLTDGSWGLDDSAGFVSSVSIDANGVHTITFNAITPGSNDYRNYNGANFTGPRWYRPLTISGVRVTSDDSIAIHTYVEHGTPALAFASNVTHGICLDPTSTVISSIEMIGGGYTRSGGTTPIYMVGNFAASNSVATSGDNKALCSHILYGREGHQGVTAIRNSDGRATATSRIIGQITTGIDLYEVVAIGTQLDGTTITGGADEKFYFKRRILILNP